MCDIHKLMLHLTYLRSDKVDLWLTTTFEGGWVVLFITSKLYKHLTCNQ